MQKKIKKPPASQNKYIKTNQASLLHIKINIKKNIFYLCFWVTSTDTDIWSGLCLFVCFKKLTSGIFVQAYICKGVCQRY